MTATLPQSQQLSSADVRRMESALRKMMVRVVETYPASTTDKGVRGDTAFKTDGTKMAIHNGTSWKAVTLSDTL